MDIDRVRYFCVVAKMGSISRASELLRISQPALSKAIKTLEGETGLKLTQREGRGLILTKQGLKFVEDAEPQLASWMRLREGLSAKPPEQSFRLGTFEVFSTYFLNALLPGGHFSNLILHEYTPGRLEQALVEGHVDCGISYLPVPVAGITFKEATRISMGVYGLKGAFPNGRHSTLPFVVPIAAPLQGTPTKVAGLDGWPDHEVLREIKFRVALMQSALEICSQGLAVAYLPDFVVKLYNKKLDVAHRLSPYRCQVPTTQRKHSVYILQRQGESESPQVRSVAKALRSVGS